MATYLLTWNPVKWHWADLRDDIAMLRRTGELASRWSCAGTKRIRPGDRVFLLRQGVEPRGIAGAGWASSAPYEDVHWNPEAGGRPGRFVDIVFTDLFDPEIEPILPRATLESGALAAIKWNPRSSGVSIPDEIAEELERAWEEFVAAAR